ncbi:MAG: N-acetylmuramoyl-L-alanine amidase [Pseudomonadota bacterium]
MMRKTRRAFRRLSGFLAALAAAPAAAEPAQVETLRLRLPQAAPYAVAASPDGARLVVDLGFEGWTEPPRRLAGPEAALRAGYAPDGAPRLVVIPEAPATLRSAALRADASGAVLSLVLAPFDGPAPRPQAAPPAPAPKPDVDAPLVVIDPGHGGIDPGAVVGEIREKDIASAFAAELADALRATGRWRVALTREDDRFLRLDARWRRADRLDADVLLSIHANTVERGDAVGATVFTLSEFGGAADLRALARLENQGEAARPPAPSPPERRALQGVARRLALAESRAAGDALAYALSIVTPMLRGRAHEQAGFRVLRSSHTPSALIELGFLTNAEDLARLQDPDWRARTAAAITAGLETWRARAAGLSSDPARRYAGPRGIDRVASQDEARQSE